MARRGRNIGVVAAARELTELGLLRAARRADPPPVGAVFPAPGHTRGMSSRPDRGERVVGKVMTPDIVGVVAPSD